MCGRFVQIDQNIERMKSLLNSTWSLDSYPPHPRVVGNYNVPPGETVMVAARPDSNLELFQMTWGLIPEWNRDNHKLIFNARSETITERPTFRTIASNRAIIPVEGFYEWARSIQSTGKPVKRPFFFRRADGETMLLAGLYKHQINRDTGEITDSFVILTMGANSFMQSYHDRMPIIVEPDQVEGWLSTAPIASQIRYLTDESTNRIHCYPVSNEVNFITNNSPLLMQPVEVPVEKYQNRLV